MKEFGWGFRVACFSLLYFLCYSPQTSAKYKRALVFSGGGMQIPMFIGMLEGLKEAKKEPDLIIGTCGGSIAAAIVQTYPYPREYLHSREFHSFVRSPNFERRFPRIHLQWVLTKIQTDYQLFSSQVPNFFDNYLVKLPFPSGLSRMNTGIANTYPRVVIVAGQTDYGQKGAQPGQKRKGRKLVRETFFTDTETAQILEGFVSPIGTRFPDSAVSENTLTFSHFDKETAVRASVSDPYYFNPFQIDDYTYVSGAVDLYPIELAKHLADEVILSYDSDFDTSVMIPAHYNIYHYNNQERLRGVLAQEADVWIDRSDFSEMVDEMGLSPIVVRGKFVSHIPEDLEAFRKIVDLQIEWGKERAHQALFGEDGAERPRNSRDHILVKKSRGT